MGRANLGELCGTRETPLRLGLGTRGGIAEDGADDGVARTAGRRTGGRTDLGDLDGVGVPGTGEPPTVAGGGATGAS